MSHALLERFNTSSSTKLVLNTQNNADDLDQETRDNLSASLDIDITENEEILIKILSYDINRLNVVLNASPIPLSSNIIQSIINEFISILNEWLIENIFQIPTYITDFLPNPEISLTHVPYLNISKTGYIELLSVCICDKTEDGDISHLPSIYSLCSDRIICGTSYKTEEPTLEPTMNPTETISTTTTETPQKHGGVWMYIFTGDTIHDKRQNVNDNICALQCIPIIILYQSFGVSTDWILIWSIWWITPVLLLIHLNYVIKKYIHCLRKPHKYIIKTTTTIKLTNNMDTRNICKKIKDSINETEADDIKYIAWKLNTYKNNLIVNLLIYIVVFVMIIILAIETERKYVSNAFDSTFIISLIVTTFIITLLLSFFVLHKLIHPNTTSNNNTNNNTTDNDINDPNTSQIELGNSNNDTTSNNNDNNTTDNGIQILLRNSNDTTSNNNNTTDNGGISDPKTSQIELGNSNDIGTASDTDDDAKGDEMVTIGGQEVVFQHDIFTYFFFFVFSVATFI